MPVNEKVSFPFTLLGWPDQIYLSDGSRVDNAASHRELLLKHTHLLKTLWKLKRNHILVDRTLQFDLDLEPHRHTSAPSSEVSRGHEVASAVYAPCYFLENLQCARGRCLTRSVFPNQQDR